MARRRNRPPLILEVMGPVIGIVFILAFVASGYNLQRFGQILQGFFTLLVVGFLFLVVVAIVFLVVRRRGSSKPGHPSINLSTHKPPQTSFPDWPRLAPSDLGPDTDLSTPAPESMVEKLRATDWYQFEKVVGAIYESQGYQLSRRGGANPDGGIDLLIEKDGERAAVQCKRWKKWKVDVPKVRELIGAMTHERLSRGVIVTLQGFTLEAKQLAVEHNIDIVHDENLAVMIDGLSPKDQLGVQAMLDDKTKHCPKCESVMEWKMPSPGKNWKPFWGCLRYPRCRGTLEES